MRKTTKVRCFHFDENGEPRRKGCLRGEDCTFLHPEDPGWETGIAGKRYWIASDHQPDIGWNDVRHGQGKSSYHDRHDNPRRNSHQRREYDDSRRPSGSKSRSRLSRSPTSRHSRDSRSSGEHSRRRKDSDFYSRDRRYETEREGRRRSYDDPATHQRDRHRGDHSPSSIASSTNEPPRPTEQLDSAMTSTRVVLPTPPTTTESLESAPRDVGWSIPTSSHPSTMAPPTHPTTIRRDSIAKPPPPPSATPPPPPISAPPPSSRPAPEPRQGLKLEIRNAAPPELSPEEKVTMWLERTKLLADSVKEYERFQIFEEEYNNVVKATESRFFNSLPAEDRKRLTTQAATILSQRDGALRAYQEIRDQLLETSSWPIAPLQLSAGEREQRSALVKNVNELRDTVGKVLHELGEIHKPPPQLFLAGTDSDEEEETRFMPMDVDQPSGSTSRKIPLPSRKRQRMDDLVDDIGHARSSQRDEDTPTKEELEEYRDKLARYEDKLSKLWNHCHTSEADQLERFKDELGDRIEKIQQKRAKVQQARDSKRKEQENARQDAIRRMDAQITHDGKDIEELSINMASMFKDVDELQSELQRETEAREVSYQRVEEVDKRLQSYITAQQANASTLDTLRMALKAYTTRPPSPPMSPKVPASSYLLQSLEQPLIDKLRESIQPLIQQLRTDVDTLVQEKNAQLFSTVWEKISQTLKVLSLIQQRMDAGRPALQPQPSMGASTQ